MSLVFVAGTRHWTAAALDAESAVFDSVCVCFAAEVESVMEEAARVARTSDELVS